MSYINGKCAPIAIGSFPFTSPAEALDTIFSCFREIPLWPQLPEADPQEQMYIQYYEGMPGIVYDEAKERLTAQEQDDAFFDSLAVTFEHAMEGNLEYFAISPDKARGFRAFLEQADRVKSLHPRWVKGHITGPVSFGLVICDQNMKPVLYDDSYREMIREVLRMKALWQVSLLEKIHPQTIIFIDEPYLASFGSSMVALSREDAVSLIGGIVDALREKGALSGVHCCGNTDWSILFDTKCDIISFDAYEYGDTFLLYRDGVREFLHRGSAIAWGVVPTSEKADAETPESLAAKVEALLERLEDGALDRKAILKQSFISPACGLGNVEKKRAEHIMGLVNSVSKLLREKYQL